MIGYLLLNSLLVCISPKFPFGIVEVVYVRTLSVIFVYKLVYYFLRVSVTDKQLRVFEVIMHIFCSVRLNAVGYIVWHYKKNL